MRRYESVVILSPDMGDDDIRTFTERYTQLVKTSGGDIIKIEDWGLKRLAYLVEKKDKGRYILFDYVGTPALIAEIERQFKISEDVMKYLSVKLDHDVDLDAFKSAPTEEAPAATETAAAPAEATEAEPPVAEETVAAAEPSPEVADEPAAGDAEAQPVASESTKEAE
jgi:small subunit ribosomal protein S6